MQPHTHPTGATSTGVVDFLSRLLDTDFMARYECVAGRPEVVALHIAADSVIALAYYSIPVALLVFVRRRQDLRFSSVFVMFAAFILACGTTHVLDVLAFWWPAYRLDGVIKAVTALLSIGTAGMLWMLIPRAMALPSPASLAAANAKLRDEVKEKEHAREELRRAGLELEDRVQQRTSDLEKLNAKLTDEIRERTRIEETLRESEERFRLSIQTSPITVFNQDSQLRYTWINNPQSHMRCSDVIGKRDEDLFTPEAAEELTRLKRSVLETGSPVRAEISISASPDRPGVDTRFFEFRAEPLRDGEGRITGITGVKVDITQRKLEDQHRVFLMAELDHRVKNNLAMVLALAEESIGSVSTLEEFREAFGGRVRALAKTHTALAASKWEGVRMDELVNLTLGAYLMARPPRMQVSGEGVLLSAKGATAICMLLNELATNAAKHGSLSHVDGANVGEPHGGGEVTVRWARVAKAGEECEWLRLEWIESGGPAVRPPKRRGLGMEVVEGSAAYELGGSATLNFQPTGLRCVVEFPLNPQNTRRNRFENAAARSPGEVR